VCVCVGDLIVLYFAIEDVRCVEEWPYSRGGTYTHTHTHKVL
jgi:hypothetical protein